MSKKRYILVLVLLCLFGRAYCQSTTIVRQLLSGNKEEKSAALSVLLEEKDIAFFPLIEAINNKKLYNYQGTLVTLGEKIKTDKLNGFELVALYPQKLVMTNKNGDKLVKPINQLEEIAFGRKERLSIMPLLPYINLVSENEEKRKLAYVQFQQKGTEKDLLVLAKARDMEVDEGMKRFATETIFSIELNSQPSSDQALKVVAGLVENKGDNTAYILEEYLKTIQPETALYQQVSTELASLNARADTLLVIQNIFSGFSLGSILIMIALGLSIIYGLAGVINMAHGEFMMIGAYTAFCIQQLLSGMGAFVESDVSFILSLPLAFVLAGACGLVIERLVLRKLYAKPLESLLATWGISLVLIQAARSIFGDLTSVKTPTFLSGGWEVVPQLVLPYNRLFIIVVTLLLVMAVYMFLYKSKYGLRIRSVTQNRNMSACLGISTARIDSLTFFIGSGIAGLAGCCITLIGNVVPDMGQTYVVDSFLVVVTGGVGNLFGSVVAGLGIGQFTKFLEPVFHAVYGKVIILIIIILFLQFKPRGLFPVKGRIADDD